MAGEPAPCRRGRQGNWRPAARRNPRCHRAPDAPPALRLRGAVEKTTARGRRCLSTGASVVLLARSPDRNRSAAAGTRQTYLTFDAVEFQVGRAALGVFPGLEIARLRDGFLSNGLFCAHGGEGAAQRRPRVAAAPRGRGGRKTCLRRTCFQAPAPQTGLEKQAGQRGEPRVFKKWPSPLGSRESQTRRAGGTGPRQESRGRGFPHRRSGR